MTAGTGLVYMWVCVCVCGGGVGTINCVFTYVTEKGKWLWDVMGKTSGMFLQSLFV